MLRRIPLGNMRNLRDLGGYAAGNGTTLWERVLRGDLPRGLTEADVDWLLDRDITTVIDLRGDEELEHRPDEFKFLPGFHYHHLPLWQPFHWPGNLEKERGRHCRGPQYSLCGHSGSGFSY